MEEVYGKAASPTGVVSEMMKAAGGFGSWWMTDLINNIVKKGCIPDDWRKSILVPVYKGKGDPLVCGVVFLSLIALCYCSRATPFDYVNVNKLSTLYIKRHLP